MFLSSFIEKIHNFFMFHMFQWCSSYIYMTVSIWICLGLIMYCCIVVFSKLYYYYKNKGDILEKLFQMIRENDIVGCLQCLEQYPQSVNVFNRNGYTPFLIACANGNTQIVKVMLKKGADVKLKSRNNESPFYLATFYYIKYPQFKNATCIRELYYAGADIDEPNNKGLTPLQMAAMFGHTALAKWLLKKNASNKVIPDPFLIANSQGHQETAIVIWRMSKGFAIDYSIE